MKYKTIIAPIVAVIAITLQLVFGIEINQELQSEVVAALANVAIVGVTLYGILHNHFKTE